MKKKLNFLEKFMVNRTYYILTETDKEVKVDAINDAIMCLDIVEKAYTTKDIDNKIIICAECGNYTMDYVVEYDSNEGLWYLKIVKVSK